MKPGIRILASCFAALFLLSFSVLTGRAETTPMPDLSGARAVCFVHPESGRVICAKNESAQLPAGSTPKVMAGLLACELLGDQISRTVTVTKTMLANSQGRKSAALRDATDENPVTVTVEQLFYLALCGSYNDAYDVLAITACGSREAFVQKMNERAVELGAKNTVFADPSGVGDNSITTAWDQYCIALAASSNELYMRCASTERCSLFADSFYNYNALISAAYETGYVDQRCRGMSAGSTAGGGNCVVTSAESNGDRYLCVVLGGITDEDGVLYSYVTVRRLLNWVFRNYTYLEVVNPETEICTLPVTVSDVASSVKVRPGESLSFYLPVDAKVGEDLTFSIRLMYESLEAPVREGTMVGYVAVLYQGEVLGTAPLYTAEEVERSSLVSRLLSIRTLTGSRAVRAGLIFFVIGLTSWIAAEVLVSRHRRHKWDKYFSKKLEAPEELARRERKKEREKRQNPRA